MGRIAWFDAHARKIYGDLETFDEAILAPLQRDLIKCERALAMRLPCLGRCLAVFWLCLSFVNELLARFFGLQACLRLLHEPLPSYWGMVAGPLLCRCACAPQTHNSFGRGPNLLDLRGCTSDTVATASSSRTGRQVRGDCVTPSPFSPNFADVPTIAH